MNRKFLIYLIAAFLVTSVAVSCNSDSDLETEPYIPSSNVAITSFSLVANSKILANLDSVHFTIDLDRALIYNADSLPKGTDVSRMLVELKSSGSNVEVDMKNCTRLTADTTFTYSNADTIDFTGDVRIVVTAADEVTKRVYTVKVNVHEMLPDSLYWNRLARRDLPSIGGRVAQQRTVKYKGSAYCLMNEGESYTLATIDNPANNVWTKQELALAFTPDVRSLTATDDAAYILDTEGNLYSSYDLISWQPCGVAWKSITAGYLDKVLGVAADGGVLTHVAYPAIAGATLDAVAKGFPVAETSDMVVVDSQWNINPIGLVTGGTDADGNVTGDTWGFDGTRWAKVSTFAIPPHTGMVMVPYTTFEVGADWKPREYPTLIAFGGQLPDGTNDNTLYISRDNGVNWNRGDSLLQLPDYIEKVANADAVVFTSRLSVDSRSAADEWTYMPSVKLPAWYHIVTGVPASRATQPVTEWDCPYIYVFGGVTPTGGLSNNIWRGVINRLSFKPLY